MMDTENLTKEQLIELIKGTAPAYRPFNHPLIEYCGFETDSEWYWKEDKLKEMTGSQLEKMYLFCVVNS